MPCRIFCSSVQDYKFGFNGQKQDNEVYGKGILTTAQYWEYDTRIGRRWNLDPVDQVSISNYACFADSPILINDVLGNKPTVYINDNGDILSFHKDKLDNRVIVIKDNDLEAFNSLLGEAERNGIDPSRDNLTLYLRSLGVNFMVGTHTELYDSNINNKTTSTSFTNIDSAPHVGMPDHLSFNYIDDNGFVVTRCEDIWDNSLSVVSGDMSNAEHPNLVSRINSHGVENTPVLKISKGKRCIMGPGDNGSSERADIPNHADNKPVCFNVFVTKNHVFFYNGYSYTTNGHKPKYGIGKLDKSFFHNRY